MEWWSDGYCNTPILHYSITPLLHYSITPLLHYSITPLLHYPTTPLLHYSTTASLYANPQSQGVMGSDALAVRDGPGDKGLGVTQGAGQRLTAGAAGGDGRGVSAAGAMGREPLHAWSGQPQFPPPVVENVGRFGGSLEMAPFDESGAAELLHELPGGAAQVCLVYNCCSQQSFRFVDIGRDQGGQGQQLVAQDSQRRR